MKVVAIAAMDEARVIGVRGGLPWRLPEDMKRFAALTTGHTVLMGRKTYDSLPAKFRPLPNRKNIVISRQQIQIPGVEVWNDPVACIESLRKNNSQSTADILWVIGGDAIYKATMHCWDEIELTLVPGTHEGDAFFPQFEDRFTLIETTKAESCSFLRYCISTVGQ